MTETTTQAATPTTALEDLANRPLLFDAYPVQDGETTVNLWVRKGDELATMRVSTEEGDEDSDDEDAIKTTEIDAYLTTVELFHLAMTAGTALAKLGDRANLVGLIQGLVDELGEMH
jgi:hypothetical protein